jgi:phosphoadenosine phosphosulfate reductase
MNAKKNGEFADPSKIYRTTLDFKTEAQERCLIRLAKNGTVARSPTQLVKRAIRSHGDKLAVAWSGGRCSTVMLHIARLVDPQIKVMFVNTGVEFPATVRYVQRMKAEWDLNLTIVRPEKTFWDIVDEHGFPNRRRSGNAIKKRRSGDIPPCCKWLKEKPVAKFRKVQGIEAFITGMRASESRIRSLVLRQKGSQFYFVNSQHVWKYHPLAFWSTKQVSDYIVRNGVPINPIYEKIDRSGCWPCTAFVGWEENLAKVSPKLHEYMVRTLSERKELEHFYATRIAQPCTARV